MTRNSILEAIKMIESHDWNWRYADYGYDRRYNAAKASMQAFVKLVKTIDNAVVRDTLRNMWMMLFNSQVEEYNTCKDGLLNSYAA